MDPKDGAEHDPEPAFAADEQLVQGGADGRSWAWSRRRERSVREHHREADDHVLDAAVTARLLARGARRDQPADGRARKRARVVTQRQAARVELLLEGVAVDTRLAPSNQVGLVDLGNTVEGGHVEHDLARRRRTGAANAASTTHRRDRDVVRARPAEDRSDLVTTCRPRN